MARMIPLHSASSLAEIERRAHELFEQSGCPAGRDLDHWLQAEAEYREVFRCGQIGLSHDAALPTLRTSNSNSPARTAEQAL